MEYMLNKEPCGPFTCTTSWLLTMNNPIGSRVKHIWNVAMHVLHNFWVCIKNSKPLGPIQPSSPTKVVHEQCDP